MSDLHSHASERALLGLLHTTSQLDGVARAVDLLDSSGLRPGQFHLPAHAEAFQTAERLLRTGKPLEPTVWHEAMRTSPVVSAAGGAGFVTQLCLAGDGFDGVFPAHAKTVQELAMRRELIAKARQIAALASNFNQKPEGVALEGAAAFASLGAAGATELLTMEADLGDLLDELDAVAKGIKTTCIPSGIDVWDELIGGLQSEVVTFIGAQPSVGKSALIGTMMENLAERGMKVGLFSLEDHPRWLADRIVSRRSGVPVKRLKTERLPPFLMERVGEGVTQAYGFAANIVRDGRSGLTAAQVAATARQMIVQRGCQAIFVDHVGELDVSSQWERHDLGVTAAVRALRDVAKDCRVPVVVLAHFHRPKGNSDSEPRYMRPTSSMWANSAGIERMARVAVGLWLDAERPDEVVASILKQTNGKKDVDFTMPFNEAFGLIGSKGGRKRQGEKGYSEAPDEKPQKMVTRAQLFGGDQ